MRVVKALSLLFALCAFAQVGFAQEQHNKIRLGMLDYPPLASAKSPNQGYLSELTKRLLSDLGFQTEIVFKPWKRVYEDAKNARDDGVLAMWYRDFRTEFFVYGPALHHSEMGFVRKKDAQKRMNFPTDLTRSRIGITRGSAPPQKYLSMAHSIELATDEVTNLRKLLAGRIDVAYVDLTVYRNVIENRLKPEEKEFEVIKESIFLEPLHLAFSKYSQFVYLAPQLKEAFAKFRETEDYKNMKARHQINSFMN